MDNKEKLEKLLMDLDIEIGSTINSANDRTIVLNNMARASKILNEVIKVCDIEF